MAEIKNIADHAVSLAEMANIALKDKLMLAKTLLVVATEAKIALARLENEGTVEFVIALETDGTVEKSLTSINDICESALALVLPSKGGS